MPSPPRRLQPVAFAESWASLRAAPPCLGLPARSVPVGLSHLAVEEAGSSGDVGPGEAAHAHVPQKPLPPPRAASAGPAWLLAFVLLVFLSRSAQVGFGRRCLLVPLAHSAALRGPARSSPRSRRPLPGPAILGPCFSLLLLRACFAPGTQHPGSPWPAPREGRPDTSSHSSTSQILLPTGRPACLLLIDNVCLFFITR